MNLGLLQLLGKYISLGVIALSSLIGANSYSENNVESANKLLNTNGEVVNTIKYETVIKYNEKKPVNISNVIQKGEVGLLHDNNVIVESKDEIIEKGTGAYGIYKGKLVGYGPDCKGCSGEGYLSCKTASGNKFSLKYDGIYYEDSEYGKVRILAADRSKFPCGTIIKVEKPDGVNFLAVVMDTIGTKLKDGRELMDLAYSTQSDKEVFGADGLTGPNVVFNVQRWGW